MAELRGDSGPRGVHMSEVQGSMRRYACKQNQYFKPPQHRGENVQEGLRVDVCWTTNTFFQRKLFPIFRTFWKLLFSNLSIHYTIIDPVIKSCHGSWLYEQLLE